MKTAHACKSGCRRSCPRSAARRSIGRIRTVRPRKSGPPAALWMRSREVSVRQPILHNWLTSALGVPNDAYHSEVGRRFVIAMVARIMEPGCQADYMLVLEGPQGEMKSQFCRALAGPEYFSDNIPSLSADQVRVSHAHTRQIAHRNQRVGRVLHNVSDVETLKAFITRREEIYTPKYGRRSAANRANACSSARRTSTIGSGTKPAPAASGRSRSSRSTSNGWPSTATSFSPKRSKPTTRANRGGPTAILSDGSSPPTKRSASSMTIGPIFSPHTSNGRPKSPSPKPSQLLEIPKERLDMRAQKRLGGILRKAKWTKSQDGKGHAVR